MVRAKFTRISKSPSARGREPASSSRRCSASASETGGFSTSGTSLMYQARARSTATTAGATLTGARVKASGEDLLHCRAGLVPAAEGVDVHAHDFLKREHQLRHLAPVLPVVPVALDLPAGFTHQHDVIVLHDVALRLGNVADAVDDGVFEQVARSHRGV